jgi:hypothetical protein
MNGFLDFISSVEEVKANMEKLINEYKGKEFYIKDKMTALDVEFYNLRTLPEMEENHRYYGMEEDLLAKIRNLRIKLKTELVEIQKSAERSGFLRALARPGTSSEKTKYTLRNWPIF